ncbi:putative F-box protein [Cardamine amara subsp. amara]|uniref:F-box protein n=1 Tax=Cardamine amara subsp. amara TaxID=228776 RepID=A0ABD1A210_CARAN
MDLPESLMVMILERLHTRDIARIKLVCKEWKSLLESSYFRDVYKWGFTQSIGSCVSRFLDEVKAANKTSQVGALTSTDGLILLDMSTISEPDMYCVANPMLRQLINIPQPPPYSKTFWLPNGFQATALVTNKKQGDLLGYKVVRYDLSFFSYNLNLQMYSSDSGNWTCYAFRLERLIYSLENNPLSSNPINLNGYLHWLCRESQVLVAHSFYASTGVCRVIDLPERSARFFERPKKDYGEALTISCGALMYMKTDSGRQPNQQLKIWRLKKYKSCSLKGSWKLLWDLTLGLCLATEPVAMHPFVKEIIYLVTRQTDYSERHAYLVSGNLHTKTVQLHEDWKQEHRDFGDYQSHLFNQFKLPQRINSIPCPSGCTIFTLPDQH